MTNKETITEWFKGLQDNICTSLESLDGKVKFHQDEWTRTEGGGGRTRVFANGNVIEKGGVNFSAVNGETPKKILDTLGLPETGFYATGVSIVLHPENPWVPIIHMNVRYFEMDNGTYWFGGGIDLTPHYVSDKSMGLDIHSRLKAACDDIDTKYYKRFKEWADDYFFIKHRNETRGIGGIFFDRLNEQSEGKSKEELWKLVQNVGSAFIPIYTEYVNKYRNESYTEENKKWQFLRRGRYAEFNLVWDKGTKFGLDTNGRTESILMSLPPQASWEYNHQPENGSPEHETLKWLKKGINWLD